MPKGRKRREVTRALSQLGCSPVANSGRGDHEKWVCGCGDHTVPIPRHKDLSDGVVTCIVKRMECLPKGWLR